MLDIILALAVIAVVGFLAAWLDRQPEQAMSGRAIVNDGDSMTIDGRRIRLIGIDAPELMQTCARAGGDYACGRAARTALAQRIGDRPVKCVGRQVDRYRRLLATCSAGTFDLNAAQVLDGWAVAAGGYEDEQRAARDAGAGIWSGTFDTPSRWRADHGEMAPDPWDWLLTWLDWLLGR